MARCHLHTLRCSSHCRTPMHWVDLALQGMTLVVVVVVVGVGVEVVG